MSHIKDRWYSVRDGQRTPTARIGRGNRWLVVWYEPGTRAERSKSFARKPDAQRFAATVDHTSATGTYIDPASGQRTLRDYATQWRAIQPYGPSSAVNRSVMLDTHILPALGDIPLSRLTPSAIQGWVTAMPGAVSTRRSRLALLARILDAAVDDGVIARNPARSRSVRAPRQVRSEVSPWSVGQVEAMRLSLPDRYRIMIDLGVGLGLRAGEVAALSIDDFDEVRGIVNVTRQVRLDDSKLVYSLPKFGHTRAVPLPAAVLGRVRAHLEAYPPREVTLPFASPDPRLDGCPESRRLIITTRESGAMNRNYLSSNIWRPALRASSIDVTRANGTHVLRHTYASALLDGGVSIRAVAAYLGHQDPAFTLRTYAHLMPESPATASTALDAVLSGTSAGPRAARTNVLPGKSRQTG